MYEYYVVDMRAVHRKGVREYEETCTYQMQREKKCDVQALGIKKSRLICSGV